MKVKMPLMSVEARGAISGVEFRQTHCGCVVGRKSTASYQSTSLQQSTRGRLIAAHRAWELLTYADRAAWDAHATYPATGRNTYIAMWLRFTMAAVAPLLTPGTAIAADPLKALQVFAYIFAPYSISISHTLQLPFNDLLIVYCLPVFSHRQLPTLNKLRYLFEFPSDVHLIGISLPFAAQIYHVRIDQVSYQTGDLISRHLFRVANPGW
jgi:hypothetical protein